MLWLCSIFQANPIVHVPHLDFIQLHGKKKFWILSPNPFWDVLCFSCPSRDKDYHLRTYKSVVMANKLIDWLIAQVSHKSASSSHGWAVRFSTHLVQVMDVTFISFILSCILKGLPSKCATGERNPGGKGLPASRPKGNGERKAELVWQLSFIAFEWRLCCWQIDSPVQACSREMKCIWRPP